MKKRELKKTVRLQKFEIENLKKELEKNVECLNEELALSYKLRNDLKDVGQDRDFYKERMEFWQNSASESEKHCAWALELVNKNMDGFREKREATKEETIKENAA